MSWRERKRAPYSVNNVAHFITGIKLWVNVYAHEHTHANSSLFNWQFVKHGLERQGWADFPIKDENPPY